MQISDDQEIKVGNFVSIVTDTYSAVHGLLIAITEYLEPGKGMQKLYRVRIDERQNVDILENSIKRIEILSVENDAAFFKDFQEKYNVQCFDEHGDIQSFTFIINNIMRQGVWDNLTQDEKNNLIKNLCVDNDEIVDLISALSIVRKDNENTHGKVCELLDKQIEINNAIVEFKRNYNEISTIVPNFKWVYDFLYKYMGVEDLIHKVRNF